MEISAIGTGNIKPQNKLVQTADETADIGKALTDKGNDKLSADEVEEGFKKLLGAEYSELSAADKEKFQEEFLSGFLEGTGMGRNNRHNNYYDVAKAAAAAQVPIQASDTDADSNFKKLLGADLMAEYSELSAAAKEKFQEGFFSGLLGWRTHNYGSFGRDISGQHRRFFHAEVHKDESMGLVLEKTVPFAIDNQADSSESNLLAPEETPAAAKTSDIAETKPAASAQTPTQVQVSDVDAAADTDTEYQTSLSTVRAQIEEALTKDDVAAAMDILNKSGLKHEDGQDIYYEVIQPASDLINKVDRNTPTPQYGIGDYNKLVVTKTWISNENFLNEKQVMLSPGDRINEETLNGKKFVKGLGKVTETSQMVMIHFIDGKQVSQAEYEQQYKEASGQ